MENPKLNLIMVLAVLYINRIVASVMKIIVKNRKNKVSIQIIILNSKLNTQFKDKKQNAKTNKKNKTYL
jgi:hypothetical protein